MGVPHNGCFIMENPMKLDDWGIEGYLHFRKSLCGFLNASQVVCQESPLEAPALTRTPVSGVLPSCLRVCYGKNAHLGGFHSHGGTPKNGW